MTDAPPALPLERPVLVIGFGNVLRGDDGVGPVVADMVTRWNLAGVLAQSLHQLVPELAEQISNSRNVIFVDADLSSTTDSVTTSPIDPGSTTTPIGHVSDPGQLLALARDLFGLCPRAYLIRIPVSTINLGESLSPLAEAGVKDALSRIAILLDEHGGPLLPVSSRKSPQSSASPPHPGPLILGDANKGIVP
ncbi:hydrogenase maturation protease [Tautonia marina]|uniref:hydrogenase maturation protease n=1 Tax=Tautonia marina TaxID=2653855 RepID=UPI0012604DE1|nr:hydrogenase maturation protease [Tautonia marina]